MRLWLSSRSPNCVALPQRVIDVLHRQFGPVRGVARTPAGVRRPQIIHQRSDRPAVRGDVVRDGHQHVFIVGDAEKLCAQWDLGGQIEVVPRRLPDSLVQPAGRPCGRVDNLPAEVGSLALDHPLLGYPVGGDEQRAQALVTAHDIGKRGGQRVGIELPAQPQRHRQVVNR